MGSELPTRHRALADPSRERVLAALVEAREPLDAAELARRVGLHANTVRFHLGRLAEAGLVASTLEARSRPGRPHVLYEPTAEAGEPVEDYRFLARMLATALEAGPEPSARRSTPARDGAATSSSGARPTSPCPPTRRHGRSSGCSPTRASRPSAPATACACAAARSRTWPSRTARVICALHLGLLRGALEELRAPVQVEALRPFAEPGICVVDFAPSA